MPYKALIKYFIFIGLFLIIGIQTLILALPLIVESQIKSRLPGSVMAFKPNFSIEDIGLTRTILKDLRLGEDLTIDLVELRYLWKAGRAFQVKKLSVSGLCLNLNLDQSNRIHFNDMVFPGQGKGDRHQKESGSFFWQDLEDFFPLIPDQIRIKNSDVSLERKQGKIRIPVDMMIRLDVNRGRGDLRLGLSPLGQALDFMAALDLKAALDQGLEKSLTQLEASVLGFNPACLSIIFPDIFNAFAIKGPVDVNVKGSGQGPWQFNVSGGTLSVGKFPQISLVRWQGKIDRSHLNGTGDLTIRDGRLSDLGLNFRAFAGFEPGSEPMFDLFVRTHEMDELTLEPTGLMTDKVFIARPRLSLELNGTRSQQNGSLEFTSSSLGINWEAGKFRLKDLALIAKLSRRDKGLFPIESGEIEFTAKALASQFNGVGLTSPEVNIKAGIPPDHKDKKLSVNFDGALAGVRAVSGGSTLYMDRAGIVGRVVLDQVWVPSVAMVAGVKNGKLDVRDQGIEGHGIDIRLPLTYPFRPGTRPGALNVKTLTYDKRFNAGVSGNLIQTRDMGGALTGKITSREIPDLVLDLGLEAGADPVTFTPWADITLKSRNFVLTRDYLTRLLPGTQMSGTFEIDLSTDTHISLKDNTLDTSGSILIHDGSLDFPDLDLKAQGISGQIDLKDLIVPESLPGQALFVKSITAGQFRFDDGALRFSIEDGRSLNLENIRFKWCDGLVSTESFRLPAVDDKISLTLYCDRLEMDSLLRQIGAFDAQGGGTLNGRIPVVYNKGEISFDNGFLFSTPGRGGRIFVKDLDRMLEGFPRDTPEFSQLDLAGEALKDFQYDWAKLRLDTQGDTLEVRMELDGKPSRVLPFEYSKKMNSFMRVDASSPGSRFQGVKLDVNLKLPFNRVMKFGNKLKNIFE